MKKICFFLLIIFTTINIITAQEQITINYNAPIITFKTELIDLGTFMQYDDPSSKCEFVFTNTGKEPLIISKAKGSCGCTVPSWPKEPIMSGESGVIQVNYDEKRVGAFNKSITINSNAKNATQILKIKGKIIAVNKSNSTPLKQKSILAPTAN